MDLALKIVTTAVKPGDVAIFWLGQAGFLFKTATGMLIAVDPYLTDYTERIAGFKRLSPKLIAPQDLDLDILITSHDHPDHFDADAVPLLMANGRARLFGSVEAAGHARKLGLDPDRINVMKAGDEVQIGTLKITAVFADHGELAPDALGIMLMVSDKKIYLAADTAYHPEVVRTVRQIKPDLIIVPINGAYGNLNETEAARLAGESEARIAVPCHFWTFAIHRGDPQAFADAMREYAPSCMAKFLYQGEMFIL
ncbi:MAG TPA: hypothetical protein DD640_01305 [Clostridiales bacterium]|nr:hypothetical protein [Clostridiales bacterium]